MNCVVHLNSFTRRASTTCDHVMTHAHVLQCIITIGCCVRSFVICTVAVNALTCFSNFRNDSWHKSKMTWLFIYALCFALHSSSFFTVTVSLCGILSQPLVTLYCSYSVCAYSITYSITAVCDILCQPFVVFDCVSGEGSEVSHCYRVTA